MTDLSDQLRVLIEAAAEPVDPAEARRLRPIPLNSAARRSRRPFAMALAGVAAVALAILGLAALVTGHDADERIRTATTVSTADPGSCYPNPCGDVDDDEATALLGVPVAMPSGIPAGWELVSSEVEFHPAGVEVDGQPPSPVDRVLLRRNWSPPGESWAEGCPTSISLRVVPLRPGGADAGQVGSTYLTLPDGTPVYGTVGPGVCGDGAGQQAETGWLSWTHAGVEYGLRSFGAPAEALRSIVTSLP